MSVSGFESHLLLVEVVVGAHLVLNTDALHIEDLCAGELIGVLDGALADLLVADGVVHCLLHGIVLLSLAEVFVSLVGVLVTACDKTEINVTTN